MNIKKIISVFCAIAALTLISCEEPRYDYSPSVVIASLGTPADNEIWFTTTDGLHLISMDESAFDAEVADIEYSEWDFNIIRFKSKVTEIGDNAFNRCTNLYNISLPNSIKTIGNRSFYDCNNLECLTLGSGIKSIGSEAFGTCYQLYSLHIPSIAAWCQIAFRDTFSNPLYYTESFCIEEQEIATLLIPDGIKSINNYAFAYNYCLRKVVLPASITSIGKDAFAGCENIDEVEIESIEKWCQIEFANETSNPASISGGLKIKGIDIHDISISNVSRVNSYAFINCNSIKSFSADDALKRIGIDAFRNCSALSTVSLGKGIEEIGEQGRSRAFMGCEGLNKVVCQATTPPILNDDYTFESNAKDRKFYVPSEALEAYKSSPYWKKYADKIEALE